jgi:CSLREA domain-containing protein
VRLPLLITLVGVLAVLAGVTLFQTGSTEGSGAFQVTKTEDTSDGACDADCSLREAIIAANAGGGGEVSVPSGTYTIALAGADDTGAAGDLDISANVTITGGGSGIGAAGVALTTIDGDDFDTVFHVHGGASLTLNDLVVTDGSGLAGSGVGGIKAHGPLTLNNVVVTNNNGGSAGVGGILAEVDLTITDSTISNNVAAGEQPTGGVRAEGKTTITNSTFTANAAILGQAGVGGLWFEVDAIEEVLTINDSVFTSNSAEGANAAGGLYLYGWDAFLDNSLVSGNSALGDGSVGGIWAYSYFYMTNSVVDDNHGGPAGAGGLYEQYESYVVGSTISNNTAGNEGGGGIYVDSELHLVNSTVSNNTAGADGGGGIYNDYYMYVQFSTIAENTGGLAGIYNAWDATLGATIVANNQPRNCELEYDLIDWGYNADSGTTCGFDGTAQKNKDLLLGPLANNGGPTMTRALLDGSPAIDQGYPGCEEPLDDSEDPYLNLTWPQDQRGQQRPGGADCDIGAFEVQDATPTPSPTASPAPTPEGQQVVWGNANCSGTGGLGQPDPIDALLTLRHDAGLGADTGTCPPLGTQIDATVAALRMWGDIDCSAAIDPVDALKLLRFDAGLSVAQEDGCPPPGSIVLAAQ